MAVLISGDPVGEVDVTKLLELGNGRAVRVSDGLFATVEKIHQLTGQQGREDTLIELLLNLFARLVEVTCAEDDLDDVPIDEELVDRLVIDAHVGHVATTAAQEILEMVAKVKQLDQVEIGEQISSSNQIKGETSNGTQETQDRSG